MGNAPPAVLPEKYTSNPKKYGNDTARERKKGPAVL